MSEGSQWITMQQRNKQQRGHLLHMQGSVPHLQRPCHSAGDTCHTSSHTATQQGTHATPPETLPPSRGHISPDFESVLHLQTPCHPAGDTFHRFSPLHTTARIKCSFPPPPYILHMCTATNSRWVYFYGKTLSLHHS